MHAENQPAATPSEPGKSRRRFWPRIVLVAVLAAVIFLVLLPRLASIGPVRNALLRAAFPRIDGSIQAGGARLSWFAPIRFDDVVIASSDDQPVVSIARLEGNRPLWRMLLPGNDLGDFQVRSPQLHVVLEPEGSNLRRVFAGFLPKKKKPNVALGVQILDGRVTVRAADSARPWTVEPVDFAFRLKPASASPDGRPRLEIEPGVVFPRTQITPEACRDLLKYIAPVLAETTEASGSFSMSLDRWEFPLTDFARGTGAGRLTIHELNFGPGPMVRELAAALKTPPKLLSIENDPIAFWLADGRVHHSALTLHLQRLVIRSKGSVGLDGSVAMVAELPMPKHLLGEKPLEDRPLAAALAKQTLRIPIKGTLKRPKVDGKALFDSLKQSGAAMGLEILGNLGQGEQIDLGKLLQSIQERRRKRAEEKATQKANQRANQKTPQKGAQPGESDAQPKRPILRKLLRGALDEAIKGIEKAEEDSGQPAAQSRQ